MYIHLLNICVNNDIMEDTFYMGVLLAHMQ